MSVAEFDADVVVDARDCILGRVASKVAQRALDGETVAVVNAERAVITGNEQSTLETFRKRRELGSDRGPAYPRRPDGIFKRAIRGMVPHKKPRGREAFERVRVYVGNPYADDDDHEATVLADTSLDRLSNINFTSLGDVSEDLGANVTW
ncbi:MAG: 50S ribosomal protein L13 [Halobaculum sp.]|jgi:large subunit ribosomal protein L13